jgi:hypothetical protein
MGTDEIRYLIFLCGRWRWRPTKTMRTAGFRLVNLSKGVIINGQNVPTADDKNQALELNDAWDRHRLGLGPAAPNPKYPHGSLGDAYLRALALRESERRNKGTVWTTEQRSRDDWPRVWKWIEPIFGDVDPKTVTPEQLIDPDLPGLRPLVAAKVSETEAHRTIKVWRRLWQYAATFGYCDANLDPSFAFANAAPPPRQDVWREGEAVRIAKQAWSSGYFGLTALLAVAWDTQLSPVDVRNLKAHQRRTDPVGTYFETGRTKTGRKALATLSRRAVRVLDAYLAQLGAEPVGTAKVFRNRSGAPYSKDTLGDDFRAVRTMVFGPSETRQLQDFRRSGTVEALAGKVAPTDLSSKMANSISQSTRLQKTYGPVQLASVRDADAARRIGRARIREQNPDKSVMAPAGKCHNAVQQNAKPLK